MRTADEYDKALLKRVYTAVFQRVVCEPDNTTKSMRFDGRVARFEFKAQTEFNPSETIFLRDAHPKIVNALQDGRSFVVIGRRHVHAHAACVRVLCI